MAKKARGRRVRKVIIRGKPTKKAKRTKADKQRVVRPEELPRNTSLLVIEDNVIKAMMADPRFTNAIPCLQSGKIELKNVSKKCGRCSRRRTSLRRKAFNNIRRCLANLAGSQRGQIKKLLGVQRVRVVLKGGRQHVTY